MGRKFKAGDMVRRTQGRHGGMVAGQIDRVVEATGVNLKLENFGVGHWDAFFELASTGPVSETTVVKKVINEGTFDGVSVMAVQDKAVQLRLAPTSNGTTTWFEASDIRSMITVLGQLADALEAA